MSNQFEINANNTSHTLGIAGEAEMSGIFWVKNFISESAFSAIAQPLFYAFGGITLAKMLIESGKSYKDIYIDNIDNIDKNNKDKITQLAELIKTVNNKTENSPSINKYLAKGSVHTLGFIIHLIKTQAADIFNPYSKLKWHERALKLANLAVLVVCFGSATAAISKVAPIIFLGILSTSAIAAIYNAGEKLHQAIKTRKTNQTSTISQKAELALTVTNFAATITGVVGLFLFPSMGIVNKASKTMGLAGASLQSSGVALSFRNAYNNWNKKDKTKQVTNKRQDNINSEEEILLG